MNRVLLFRENLPLGEHFFLVFPKDQYLDNLFFEFLLMTLLTLLTLILNCLWMIRLYLNVDDPGNAAIIMNSDLISIDK